MLGNIVYDACLDKFWVVITSLGAARPHRMVVLERHLANVVMVQVAGRYVDEQRVVLEVR